MNKIIIRADASVQIGTGHVMRCLTLADELRERGAVIVFVCREFNGNLCSFIEKKGYIVHRLPISSEQQNNLEDNLIHSAWLGSTWQDDACQVEEIIKKLKFHPDWIVVDHYAVDIRWEEYLRPLCKKIMVIDDLADRAHNCDFLLDQNWYDNLERRYDGLVPVGCPKMLGPKYALLRPEFREVRESLRTRNGQIKRIMIFFGGSDSTGETSKALEAVSMLKMPDVAVDVVVGSSNLRKKRISELCAAMPNVVYHCQINNMAKLMACADLFIGSAGSSTWERCCLGLPGLIMSTASNQEAIAVGCDQSGIGIHINKSKHICPHQILIEIKKMFLNQATLMNMGEKSLNMVDGRGGEYVASLMLESQKQGVIQ